MAKTTKAAKAQETVKMTKFKTNVSFVGSDGVFHEGGSVVQLPSEDFAAQVDVCEEFGLPVPELIEEVDAVVEGEPSGEGQTGNGEGESSGEGQTGESDPEL